MVMRPLNIITFNYDAAIEECCRGLGIPCVDGSDTTPSGWNSSRLRALRVGSSAVRLLKLHGSATWYRTRDGVLRRFPSASALPIGAARSLTNEAALIYPSSVKLMSHGPFPDLFVLARDVLRWASVMIVVGYSFRDAHVREVVLDALESNKRARILICDPDAANVAARLLRHGRTGCLADQVVLAPKGRRSVLQTFKGSWIEGAIARLSMGSGHRPSVRSTTSSLSLFCRSHASLRWRFWSRPSGGVVGLGCARQGIYATTHSDVLLEVKKSRSRIIARLPTSRLRGLAIDEQGMSVYILSNVFGRLLDESTPAELTVVEGLGSLWSVSLQDGSVRRALRPDAGRTKRARIGSRGSVDYLSTTFTGVLRWPTAVVVEDSGKTLLIAEARQLLRFRHADQRLDRAGEIPLCFNLNSLHLGTPRVVYAVDGGVYPEGFGRLMRIDLDSREATVLGGGWSRMQGVYAFRSGREFLVSRGLAFPNGDVMRLKLSRGGLVESGAWHGLDRPGSIVNRQGALLVATARGIVELETVSE
jgi:SIR2-like protein